MKKDDRVYIKIGKIRKANLKTALKKKGKTISSVTSRLYQDILEAEFGRNANIDIELY